MAAGSYSELLLARVREGMKRRGLNRAALAKQLGVERRHLRSVLAGRTPLTVDEMFAMIEALQLTPTELGLPAELVGTLDAGDAPDASDGEPSDGEVPVDETPEGQGSATPKLAVADLPPPDAGVTLVDPDGPQAAEILRLGFALGVDMHFVCAVDQLRYSGVPETVLARFPELLPIKLDAAYHHAHRAQYLPDGLHLRLSFDRIRSCVFPWSCIRQVTLFPEAPLESDLSEDPETESELMPMGGPTLRLVKS
jgi:transcriptional regulator with XRE-family HTH domain